MTTQHAGAAKAEREAQALEKEASDKADEAEAKRAQEAKCRAKDGAAGLASQRRKELKKAVDDASTEVARLEAAQKGAQTAFDADDSRLKGEADAAADNERIESAKQEEVRDAAREMTLNVTRSRRWRPRDAVVMIVRESTLRAGRPLRGGRRQGLDREGRGQPGLRRRRSDAQGGPRRERYD